MTTRWLGKTYILALSLALFFSPGSATAQTITYGSLQTYATPETFVDTGSGGTTGGETVSGNTPTQWVAAQFTLTQAAAITQVEGWFGSTGGGGSINVVIHVDNAADPSFPVSGAAIWSQSFTVPAQTSANWVTFSPYAPVLAAGTYWLSFEPPTTSALKTALYGPPPSPLANYAFFVPSNGRWINMNEGGGHSTAYPAVMISGLSLETSTGGAIDAFGTAARTITQGTVFNSFPFSQYLSPIGDVGQAKTLQWNIYSPGAESSAYGQLSANANLQGGILTAGAYSASGTTSSGAARGIAFATYVNMSGADIPNVQVNAVLNGNISFEDGASFPVQAATGVYVFDTGQFSTAINSSGESLAQFFLGSFNSLEAGLGAEGLPNLAALFPAGTLVDSSGIQDWPLVCSSNCTSGYSVATGGFDLPANAMFTVLFDVSAASQGSGSGQGEGIGNFLDTLEPDPTQPFFTDGAGNAITGISGPVALVLADTPTSIVFNPSSVTNPIGSTATLTAVVTDTNGVPIPNEIVNFAITAGPHNGFTVPIGTDSNGNATLTFTDTLGQAGTDSVTASIGSLQATPGSMEWTSPGPLYTITLSPPTASISLGNGETYDATGQDFFNNSLGDVTSQLTFTIGPDGTCTGAICTPTATGTHTVTGTGNNPVVGSVTGTASLSVTSSTLSTPTITFGPAPTPTYLGSNFTVSATTNSNGALTYSYVSGPCAQVSGGTFSSSGAGTCVVQASAAATTNFSAGSTTQNVTISPATPTITFGTAPAPTYPGSNFTVSATTNSNGALTYSYVSGPCAQVSGGTFSPSGVGACLVQASTATTTNFSAGSATQSVTISAAPTQTTPVITWPTPAPITYGTPLSSTQLDATANVAGTFVYNPPAKTVLTAGLHTLSVTFTPTNTTAYTIATASVTLQVNQATPPVLWVPVPITYGTPLGPLQLDALTLVPGTFVYTPAAGTILHAGNQQLSATFTPKDTTDFQTITVHATLVVLKAVPDVDWSQPAPITVGTPLSAKQLDATANVPGTFVYHPPSGTILPVGTSVLKVTFTPTDTTDYVSASAQVALSVLKK